MVDVGWGHLILCESYGRLGDKALDYVIVPYEGAKKDERNFQHASHAMLFSKNERTLWDLYKARASISMHMRFDGLLGFPGGLVDPGEDPVAGLNRELVEEVALDLGKHKFTDNDHIASFEHADKKLYLHFFAKEVTEDELKEIELNHLKAEDHGSEVLGPIRPPLYTMGDGVRGFPAFLKNQFAGNAREELLLALLHFKIITKEELETAVKAAAGISADPVEKSAIAMKTGEKRKMEES